MKSKDPKGYYTVLGVTPEADAADIKAAYRRRAMELHPDKNRSPDATRRFQLLSEAYGVLSDPALRAEYDAIGAESPSAASSTAPQAPPEPIVCSCCGRVTAQPRHVTYFEVKSFIVQTTRSAVQDIFCSACAERKAIKATAVTWALGWWGIPWGPLYSVQALFNNLIGGKQSANVNARLAAHQAWVFAVLGKVELARAVAQDALELAKRIKPDTAMARMRKNLGYDVPDEAADVRSKVERLLSALGPDRAKADLMDSWALLRRPFYIQGAMALTVVGSIAVWLNVQSPTSAPQRATTYIANPQVPAPAKQAYVRPATAPNGAPWPLVAAYVNGFPLLNVDGLSRVTVDNSQNDSDVFCKLVSLYGSTAFPVRTFFIPAHSSFTVENVTAGHYDIRYRDLRSGRLSRAESFLIEETRTYDGVQYSDFRLTLYKVRNGNMQTYSMTEGEF